MRSFEDHLKNSDPTLHPSIGRIMPSSKSVPASFYPPDVKDVFYVGIIHETNLDMEMHGKT